MSDQPATIPGDLTRLPKLPSWVTSGPVHTSEIVAFRSGAALMALDALVTDPTYGVPVRLLANRLALRAATAMSKLEGRLVRVTFSRPLVIAVACRALSPGAVTASTPRRCIIRRTVSFRVNPRRCLAKDPSWLSSSFRSWSRPSAFRNKI